MAALTSLRELTGGSLDGASKTCSNQPMQFRPQRAAALALCALHRRALDRGAISLSEDCGILVSDLVVGTTGVQERFTAFRGRPLLAPADPAQR